MTLHSVLQRTGGEVSSRAIYRILLDNCLERVPVGPGLATLMICIFVVNITTSTGVAEYWALQGLDTTAPPELPSQEKCSSISKTLDKIGST